MNQKEIIETLKKEHKETTDKYAAEIKSYLHDLEKLAESLEVFRQNWDGEWASEYYNLYRNLMGKVEVYIDEKDIEDHIEKDTGVKIEGIRPDVLKLVKIHQALWEKLITELSYIKGDGIFSAESELLASIEKMEWGFTRSDYVKKQRPQSVFVQDPTVLNRGLHTPPHLNVNGKVFSLISHLVSIENYNRLAKRIIRQLEIKHEIGTNSPSVQSNNDFLPKLFNKFHTVVNMLKHRHDKRDPLQINDEYDVQDLLNSLLQIEYDDIRPEEYTPSYAGSSTRMDFLLKREKTVIEVKKTRERLTDKEVGDQLILDAHHYRSHPDCKRLVCFVYDPENRIKNPRGLETDLNGRLSSEDMLVEVYIRP